MSMTFADAAELVLRDAGEALPVAELWRRMAERGLVETAGATPEATLRVTLLRQSAGSTLAAGKGTPRFYRRGDGAYGLWAELATAQQQAMATRPAEVAAPIRERDFRADRDGMRADPSVAERTLAWLIPGDSARRAVLGLLADAIDDAHAAGTNRWKLTLGARSLRLTVGRCLVFWLRREVWFPARPGTLAPEDRALIEGLCIPDTETGAFRSIAPVEYFTIAPDLVSEAATAVRHAIVPIIAEAAATSEADVHGAQFHSPGALAYISTTVGRPLPAPAYGSGDEDAAPDDDDDGEAPTLADLIAEYVATFATTPAPQAYLQTYAAERAAARANLARIDGILARGEDATDAILLGLLPYTDSAKHREAGAWVSHAPAIQGDFKLWFENAKWVKPETWPQVAAEILAFVRECLAKPHDLRDAIARFTANPLSKGFSVGLLTPILNALAPDELPLVNTKVTRVVSYFAGVELEPTLADYATTIRWWRSLVDSQPALRDPRIGVGPGDAFDHFCHWLVAVKRFAFTGGRGPVAPGYWKISPGPGAELWDDWRARGVAAIGGDLLGDLTLVDDDEFAGRVATAALQDASYKMNGARQSLNLARMAVGTLLVANRGKTEVLGLGRVTGPYRFVEGIEYCHEVPVDWFDVAVRGVDRPGWARTLVQLDKSTYDDIAALPPRDRGAVDADDASPPPPPPPRYERAQFLAETAFREDEADRWFRILQDKKQIIVQGPPGTGKTWVAERLARWLVGGDEGRVHLIQFHPAYSYEDFIQGIRPISKSGAVSYELVPGRLLQLCQAMPRQGPVVLIIDEINRANLPRVFGELMFLLEYRERTMALAGGGELRLPPNLHVIGTMNTADRSIARLDHALRRRFSFLRLQPNFDVLRSFAATRWSEPVEDLIALLGSINKDIDDPNSELGISYFMKDDLAERLEDIWRCEIEPYLEEFFFDARATAAKYAWDKVAAGALAAWVPTK